MMLRLFLGKNAMPLVAQRLASTTTESKTPTTQVKKRKFSILVNHFLATIYKIDEVKREKLANFGRYIAACLPKFVQQVQVILVAIFK